MITKRWLHDGGKPLPRPQNQYMLYVFLVMFVILTRGWGKKAASLLEEKQKEGGNLPNIDFEGEAGPFPRVPNIFFV